MIRLSRLPALINTSVRLPWSKSILNRVLILKYLAGDSLQHIFHPEEDDLLANDTRLMLENLVSESPIKNVEDAGTVMRFLTALYALSGKEIFLRGTARMHQRPVRELVNALRKLGADILYEQAEGFPPLHMKPSVIKGGEIEINGSESSQFISALLMIAPYLKGGLNIITKEEPVSLSYIDLTIHLMKQWGASVAKEDHSIKVTEGTYSKNKALVYEADWSAASYWYLLVSACKGSAVNLPGLLVQSFQGDRILAEWMKEFGVYTEVTEDGCRIFSGTLPVAKRFEKDFSFCPDLVPAFAVACSLHGVHGIFHGVAHLQLKESNRIEALKTELAKVNSKLSYSNGSLEVLPGIFNTPKQAFNTWKDHRIAMSLAGFACFVPVEIEEEEVVNKSYPSFWANLVKAGFVCK